MADKLTEFINTFAPPRGPERVVFLLQLDEIIDASKKASVDLIRSVVAETVRAQSKTEPPLPPQAPKRQGK